MSPLPNNVVYPFYASVADFNQQKLADQALSLLTDQEKNEQNRFVFQKERDQYLTARHLLRTKLTEISPRVRPADWVIMRDSYSKPYLDPLSHPDGPFFNVSHSSGVIMCAISGNPKIGVDIEYNKEPIAAMDIAQQNFAENEIRQLQELAPDKRLDFFYKIWTLKESYIKAIGNGLSHPLKSFYFDLTNSDQKDIAFYSTEANDNSRWQFRLFNPYPDFQAAVALPCSEKLEIFNKISFE